VKGTRESSKKIFSLSEARALLPEVRRITQQAYERIETLRGRVQEASDRGALESEAGAIVQAWAESIQALGLEVKGLWLVDFDNGSGYYCWQHPEAALEYYHSYEEGFRGRMRIH
jgi:hypothetical protein